MTPEPDATAERLLEQARLMGEEAGRDPERRRDIGELLTRIRLRRIRERGEEAAS
jgi:hypothetical protein